MDWMKLLYEIIEVCLIPLLGILTAYIVKFINFKKEEIKVATENEQIKVYIDMLAQTISDCVIATNQTYTEALKEQGTFDLDAQRKAFELTYKSVLAILGEEGQKYLSQVYGDLELYIKKKIESEVNINKI